MNVLIFAPSPEARQKITRHLIESGHHLALFAESVRLVVALALPNDIQLVLLFDPPNLRQMISLKDYVRQRRPRIRVRILPSQGQELGKGWDEVIDDGLKPIKRRKKAALGTHPRFRWTPGS